MPGAFTFLFLIAAVTFWIKVGLGAWTAGLALTVVLALAGFGIGWLLSDAYRDYHMARIATCMIAHLATLGLVGYLIFG